MKNKFLAVLFVSVLATQTLFAETVIILHEVVEIGFIGGDSPLDNPSTEDPTPTRPTDFRATIDGNALSIIKQEPTIPSAHATVVNVSTGSIVINQQFTNSLQEQISASGVYVLNIQTDGGSLIGQFIVQ